MATVAQITNTVQCDTALRHAAQQARTRYPGEATRIDKGLVIALNHGVTLRTHGSATVQSASDPEVVYHVAAGVCDCLDFPRAPEGRCKHRYAVCLVKRAQKTLDAERYYASYTDPAGIVHGGIVTRTPSGWLFIGDEGEEPLYAAAESLALGGNCAIADAKRAEEEAAGGLVAVICGYGK